MAQKVVNSPKTAPQVQPVTKPVKQTRNIVKQLTGGGSGNKALGTTPKKIAAVLPDKYSSFDRLEMLRVPTGLAKQSNRRYLPYETLSGISKDTPELVSITEFVPIVKLIAGNHPMLTAAGKYFDQQVTLRDTKLQNVASLLSELRSIEDIDESMRERIDAFAQSLQGVQGVTSFMLDTVLQLEKMKSYLDLKNDFHRVNPSVVAANYKNFRTYTEAGSLAGLNFQVQPFDIPDVLTQLGFNHENVSNFYSSTKLWLQMLLEYKETIRTHSLGLTDGIYIAYKVDKNPGVLVKPNRTRFDISLVKTYSMNELVALTPEQTATAINGFRTSFQGLYANSQFRNDEHRFAAISCVASREYRLSRGLSFPEVQLALKSYGYNVAPSGNVAMLDAFLGTFGNDIGDIVDTTTNSLVGISQRRENDIAVLTFEEKYVQGDNGILTPGSEYYVDSLLKLDGTRFNTFKLNNLSNVMLTACKNFVTTAIGLNLTMAPIGVSTSGGQVFNEPYVEPRLLFESISRRFLNAKGETLQVVKDDPVTAVFAAAEGSEGRTLKATLFTLLAMYVVRNKKILTTQAAIFGESVKENTATIDHLAVQVENQLSKMFKGDSNETLNKKYRPGESNKHLVGSSLVQALKGSSPVLNLIVQAMMDCYSAFSKEAVFENRTRYSGYTDTVMLMTIFDLIIGCIAKYGNRRITGSIVDQRLRIYVLSQNDTLHLTSIKDIETRLNRETSINQQIVYSIFNTLSKTATAAATIVRNLNSDDTKKSLLKLSQMVNNSELLETMFSKQQIMMLASQVSDLKLGAAGQSTEAFKASTFIDVDGDGDYDFADSVRLLDDSVVCPKLRDAIVGYFGTSEFSTEKAVNKRIMTIGIPVGLSEHVNQLASARGFAANYLRDKQADVFYVNIHKVDLRNPDVIYSPVKKLFELSRFPVRSVTEQPVFQDSRSYVDAFPTRDYSQQYESLGEGSSVQYLEPNTNQTPAFNDDSYSFLSADQKREIVQNTVASFLLEKYVRILSGIDVSELSFTYASPTNFIEPDYVRVLVDGAISCVIDKKNAPPKSEINEVFFGSKPTKKDANKKSENDAKTLRSLKSVDLTTLDEKTLTMLNQYALTLDVVTRTMSPIAGTIQLEHALVSPKKFDRVVSIVIDPDDFVIDVGATWQSEEGQASLKQLIASGVLTSSEGNIDPNTIRSATSFVNVKRRDTKQGDVSFEKYFVTLSTLGNDVV